MEIKQLQALIAIADEGSFSAAARALDTVQSNVSAHIARLENELGAALIDRATGTLTEEGDIVATRARRILHEIQDIDTDIHSLGDSPAGESTIGVIGTTARWLMPPVLLSLARHHPGVRTTVVEGATSSLLPRLLNGQLDAAVLHMPVSDPSLEAQELFAEELLLLAPTHHPLAAKKSVTLTELGEHPLLQPPRGTAQRRIVDRAAANVGVSLTSQAEIDGVRLMASLVFDGFGAAIVPASAIPAWLTGDWVRVAVPELPRRVVGWVQRARPRPNRPTLAVRDTTFEVVSRHGPRQPGVSLEVGVTRRRLVSLK